MVLTGTGAAPPLPPGSWLRTLGSKHATHSRFHLPSDQRCKSEGGQKRGHQSSPAQAHHANPCPSLLQLALSPISPTWPPTSCQSTSEKLGQLLPLPGPYL